MNPDIPTSQGPTDDCDQAGWPLRIVLVTSYPFPYIGATANRVRALADAVARRPGVTVTVVGPGPDIDPESVAWENFNYKIRNKPEGAYAKRNLVQRAFREIRQTARLLWEARRCEPDALMVTSPSVFLLSATVVLRSKPVLVDLRDLVWEYFLARGGIARVAGWLLGRFSLMCLHRARRITVTNDREAESLVNQGLQRPTLVRNGIDAERFRILREIAEDSPKAATNQLHIVYIGNVGLAQGLGTLVRAVSGLQRVRVTIVGGGADFHQVKQVTKELATDNIQLTGPLPWDRVLAYYRDADLLYAQVGAAYETAVPSKLFEYLATGRRVIFGGPEGSAVALMREFEGVALVPPDDAESLRSALQEILNEPTKHPLLDNVRQVEQEHLRESQAERFADLMQRIAEDRKL